MICNVESQRSAEITWRYYSEDSLLRMSNAMHRYVSFLFLVVFVCISESVRGCIIIIIHRVYSFTDRWQLLQKLRKQRLQQIFTFSSSAENETIVPPLTILQYDTHAHTQQVCLCAERNDKWAPRFSVARLALRVSGPSALTVSPVKKKRA